jgi:hypothetical protein
LKAEAVEMSMAFMGAGSPEEVTLLVTPFVVEHKLEYAHVDWQQFHVNANQPMNGADTHTLLTKDLFVIEIIRNDLELLIVVDVFKEALVSHESLPHQVFQDDCALFLREVLDIMPCRDTKVLANCLVRVLHHVDAPALADPIKQLLGELDFLG